MDELKTILFDLTLKALTAYTEASEELKTKAGNDYELIDKYRRVCFLNNQRFLALWDVIEAAELPEEYEAWKNSRHHG